MRKNSGGAVSEEYKDRKTTPEDFVYFKKCVLKWVKKFGLIDWELDIIHEKNVKDCRGDFLGDFTNRVCAIRLSGVWNSPITKRQLDRVAYHEVMEMLMAKLHHYAVYKHGTELQISEEVHVIIRTLENLMFGINDTGGYIK